MYKAHIKLAGLQPGTVHKYKCGIARFFNWISVSEFSFPSSLEDLDFVAGEFVNHLYDFVCGLGRCTGSACFLWFQCRLGDAQVNNIYICYSAERT